VHLAFDFSVYFIATPRTIARHLLWTYSLARPQPYCDAFRLGLVSILLLFLVFLALVHLRRYAVSFHCYLNVLSIAYFLYIAFRTFSVTTHFIRIVFLPNVVGLVFSPSVCVI
jgi:hypothetical protein